MLNKMHGMDKLKICKGVLLLAFDIVEMVCKTFVGMTFKTQRAGISQSV
jgi:hypothetical protein